MRNFAHKYRMLETKIDVRTLVPQANAADFEDVGLHVDSLIEGRITSLEQDVSDSWLSRFYILLIGE
jgi:hypothetical protein